MDMKCKVCGEETTMTEKRFYSERDDSYDNVFKFYKHIILDGFGARETKTVQRDCRCVRKAEKERRACKQCGEPAITHIHGY